MGYDKNKLHYVVVTGILVDENEKFLITKRADWEKAFPGRWTVPGGKLEVLNYALKQKDTISHWYNVLEDVLKREIMEEVDLEIENIGYVTSLVYIRDDNIPCLIISLLATPKSKDVKLCSALTEFKWVDLKEAKNYDLIEGIYEELEIVEKMLRRSAYPLEGRDPENLNTLKGINDGAKTGEKKEWKIDNKNL